MPCGAESCLELLTAEGFRPSLDEWGSVRFKFEGGHYVLQFDAKDTAYLRLLYPCFWPMPDQDVPRALVAANEATEATKLVKVFVLPDPGRADVCASVESLVDTPEQLRSVLFRYLGLVQIAVRRFADRMRAQPQPVAGPLAAFPLGKEPAPN